MKLLFVSTIDAVFGGSEILWTQTALHLAREGHDVAAYLPFYKSHPTYKLLITNGVKLFYGSPNPKKFYLRLFDPLIIKHGLDYCYKTFNPSLTCITLGNHLDLSSFSLSRPLFKLPYVLLPQLAMPAWASDEHIEWTRNLYSNASKIYFTSNENRLELAATLSLDINRINSLVIGNSFQRLHKDDNDLRNPAIICVPCRLDYLHKGIDLILRALLLVKSILQEAGVKLRFYTSDTNSLIQEFIFLHGLADVADVCGPQPMQIIINESDAMLLASRFEGMSVAMLECMYAGIPVFATESSGASEIIIDEVSGLIADCASVASIANLLRRSCRLKQSWRQMGLNGSLSVSQRFETPAEVSLAKDLLLIQ